jgi:hypothetical protein
MRGKPKSLVIMDHRAIRLQEGKFRVSEPDTIGETADQQYVTGRVGKKGNATGTIRLLDAYSGGGFCDSGVVTWTAQPAAKFSPPEIPPCALSGTCPIP